MKHIGCKIICKNTLFLSNILNKIMEVKIFKQKYGLAQADVGSSGYDICSIENKVLAAGKTGLFSTGIFMELPLGYECQVRSRSGLAAKHSVFCLNSPGTIDSSYRGEIKVILHNCGEMDYQVNAGDKIAQCVFQKIEIVNFTQVDSVEALSETERGAGGFGHSDAN